MQFTDRELLYTGPYLKFTVRTKTVNTISPSDYKGEIF